MRTMVASRAMASANPNPICFITSNWAEANPPNTITISSAAEVMIRPERCKPSVTASVVDSPCSCNSTMRASRNTS
jgi:hypothetical protein